LPWVGPQGTGSRTRGRHACSVASASQAKAQPASPQGAWCCGGIGDPRGDAKPALMQLLFTLGSLAAHGRTLHPMAIRSINDGRTEVPPMTTTRWPCIVVAVLGCLLTLVGLRRVRVGAVGLSARRQAASGVHKPHERGVHRHAEREGRESAARSGGIRVLPRHQRSAWPKGK
jgi:hypothetical protein